ncbi:hypothetical protein FMN50_10125 [Rhodobacterales bacterium]|nr:hypothetical protein FMN50_10125 [Rhodobacterales bacterium]
MSDELERENDYGFKNSCADERSSTVVVMMMSAISGAIVASLLRGSVFEAAILIGAAFLCAFIGWWARGVVY